MGSMPLSLAMSAGEIFEESAPDLCNSIVSKCFNCLNTDLFCVAGGSVYRSLTIFLSPL